MKQTKIFIFQLIFATLYLLFYIIMNLHMLHARTFTFFSNNTTPQELIQFSVNSNKKIVSNTASTNDEPHPVKNSKVATVA